MQVVILSTNNNIVTVKIEFDSKVPLYALSYSFLLTVISTLSWFFPVRLELTVQYPPEGSFVQLTLGVLYNCPSSGVAITRDPRRGLRPARAFDWHVRRWGRSWLNLLSCRVYTDWSVKYTLYVLCIHFVYSIYYIRSRVTLGTSYSEIYHHQSLTRAYSI